MISRRELLGAAAAAVALPGGLKLPQLKPPPKFLTPAEFALLEELSGGHARLYPFATFDDVVGILDREAEAWLASFSSTTAAAD